MDNELKRANNSPWPYFIRNKSNSTGVCNVGKCGTQIKAVGGSTSGLHSHLRTHHNINLLKREKEDSAAEPERIIKSAINTNSNSSHTGKITNYFTKTFDESFSAVVSRLIARDGLPFKKLCTSYDLRNLLKRNGFPDVPKSPNTIKKMVMNYGQKIRVQVMNEVLAYKNLHKRFSLTFDEWTSIKNRRYININLHANDKFWNLGLTRIHGSMPATKGLEIITKKINEFKLSFQDIVSMTTDGASVMIKLGKLTNINHQLCLAHGIQLAVLRVLYQKPEMQEEDEEAQINSPCELNDNETTDEDPDSDDDEGLNIMTNLISIEITHPHIHSIIAKVRKVVKIFRRSPTKNDDVLQKHVRDEFGKELSLLMDSKTRWNSLFFMLERFYRLKNCVRKSLIDLNIGFNFAEDELSLVSDIILALQPIKLAVESLCCEDSNLLCADITIKFMLDELSQQKNLLSNSFKEELIHRMMQRRTNLSDVLQFLSDPSKVLSDSGDNYDLINITNKTVITKIIINLIERLLSSSSNIEIENMTEIIEIDQEIENNVIGAKSVEELDTLSMKERLNLKLKENQNLNLNLETSASTAVVQSNKILTKVVRREIVLFEDEKRRGKYLQLVYEYLMTIRPTSVDSERAFSAAGLICTKIRSQLSDESIGTLCFLRAHFNMQNNVDNK